MRQEAEFVGFVSLAVFQSVAGLRLLCGFASI